MIASGSVLKQIDILYDRGATGKAYLSVTHPVLLPKALQILDQEERIEKLVVTNTIPLPTDKKHPKIEVLSIAPLLADVIQRIHTGVSISERLILS
jgi:ribose-phosphate pyrophosphokinase